jgi:hypothetical protein
VREPSFRGNLKRADGLMYYAASMRCERFRALAAVGLGLPAHVLDWAISNGADV